MQGWQRDSDPHSEFLGPRWVGASVNHGAFFLKLRLKPLPFALAVGLRIRYLSDLRVSQVPGEIRWIARWQSIAVACVSLAFRLADTTNRVYYSSTEAKKSVPLVTHPRDQNHGAAKLLSRS